MTDHKITNNGFSPLVQTPGLFLCIVVAHDSWHTSFGVYMRHGSPGGAFWRNGGAIRSFETMGEAQELVDRLAGLRDAHKSFPVYTATY